MPTKVGIHAFGRPNKPATSLSAAHSARAIAASASTTARRNAKTETPKEATEYRHPTADLALRPEIGTQANFRKRKPPATYRYDTSLSPALDWESWRQHFCADQ
jgi:hypothetical protein